MARWDWYQSTVHGEGIDSLAPALMAHFPESDLGPARGRHGYSHGTEIKRGDQVLVTLLHGGQPGINVTGSGERAPALAQALVGYDHQPTRVDAAWDWVEPGLFDRFADHFREYALEHNISLNHQGDWSRGEARTLYVGSKSSPVRVCLYEKGYEQGCGADLNWVRFEVRVRPNGRDKREQVRQWTPDDVAGASTWLADALKAFGWDDIEPRSVGTVWRPSDSYRARLALLKQYGATMRAWVDDAGGWDSFTAELHQALESGEPPSCSTDIDPQCIA